MSLELLPCTVSDIPTLASIYFAAFDDAISLQCFPRTPSVRTWWLDSLTSEFESEPTSRFLKIVAIPNDSEVQYPTIAAFAKWNSPNPPSTSLSNETPTWSVDSDHVLADNFFGQLMQKRIKIMGTEPHWYLEIVATLPQWQGKGAAKKLLQWGVDKADEDGLEAYLEANPQGKGIYEKFGFRVKEEVRVPVDVHWEESGEFVECCMVRSKKHG